MLKYTSHFCLFFLLFSPLCALGAIKDVTITWTIPDTSEVLGYKMYYSYSSDMMNKQLACETNNSLATTLTCEAINLDQSPIYFVIAALFSASEENSIAVAKTFISEISVVQGFSLEVPGANALPVAVISADTTSGSVPLTVQFNADGSSDSDGNVVSYSWNFGDGTSVNTTISPSHIFSKTGSFPVTLTVIDDQGLASAAAQTTITVVDAAAAPTYAINFQPGDAPTPAGFTNDHGLTFDSLRGYGWSTYMPNSRDRNDPASPDQSYDTNIIYIDSSSTWEFDLPNGDYTVTVCAGDPSYPTGLQSVQVEGTSILNDVISPDVKWQEQTLTTTVSDGRLTLTFLGSNDTKICWIKIDSTQL